MGAGLPDGLVAGGAQPDPDQHLGNLRDIDLLARLIAHAQGPILSLIHISEPTRRS